MQNIAGESSKTRILDCDIADFPNMFHFNGGKLIKIFIEFLSDFSSPYKEYSVQILDGKIGFFLSLKIQNKHVDFEILRSRYMFFNFHP